MEVPVKKNEIIEIDVIDMGDSGEGIGRLDGFTLFLHGGVTGDRVEARVIKVKKNYGIAKVVRVVTPSENRVEPACQYFGGCGGCTVMNIDYLAQKEMKRKVVVDAMERIAGLKGIEVNPTLGMDDPYHYRNKGAYPVQWKDKNILIGFYRKGSHIVVDVEECLLQHPVADRVVKVFKEYLTKFNVPIYSEEKHKGLIRHLMVRVSFASNEVMVAVVANGNKLPHEEMFIEMLKTEVPEVASIYLNINKDKGNRILGFKNRLLDGEKTIIDTIGDLKFEISPLSFFQVNPLQTKVLYGKALEFADIQGGETVFDLYCGIGTISLFLAQKARRVIGVEIIDDAVRDARRNARLNGIENADFHTGKAEEVIPKLYEQGVKADVVVVDPPRKGCDEVLLNTIVDMQPEKIVYVSCKASTMARDVKVLVEAGYEVVEVQPVDMFPHSLHVESVVKLVRK